MLTKSEQERERYEARLKAIRDQQTFMEEAAEKIEKGIEKGIERGEYIGRIHACQRLLNQPLTPSDDLLQLSRDDLDKHADAIEAEVRNRLASQE